MRLRIKFNRHGGLAPAICAAMHCMCVYSPGAARLISRYSLSLITLILFDEEDYYS